MTNEIPLTIKCPYCEGTEPISIAALYKSMRTLHLFADYNIRFPYLSYKCPICNKSFTSTELNSVNIRSFALALNFVIKHSETDNQPPQLQDKSDESKIISINNPEKQ